MIWTPFRKIIARYFYPVSLERARAVVSLLLMCNKELSSANEIEQSPGAISMISEKLSRHLIMAAKSYENRIINHGDERYVYEIYGKAITNLLKEDKKQIPSIERKNSFLRVQNKRHKPILSWF